MAVYKPRSVEQEPNAILRNWSVWEVPHVGDESGTHHFVGYNEVTRDGRVSSPIRGYDHEKRRGITRSGRVYEIVGEPGGNLDADYVWGLWCRGNGIDPAICKEVTEQYV